MTEFAEAIVKSIETHPKKWKLGEFCLSYGNNKSVELWVVNGLECLKVYQPHKIPFKFMERIDVWNAFKRWKVNNQSEMEKEMLQKKQEIIAILGD